MLGKKIYSIIIIMLLFISCSSTSMEFRSCKSAVRGERDLSRGEEFGLKALEIEMDKDNALIPYFIATEIYKPQERWTDMAAMLDEAMRRNPEQRLESPIILDPDNLNEETILLTIRQGVTAYREEVWVSIFNQGIELMNAKENELALQKFNLCIQVDPSRLETYGAITSYYVAKNDLDQAQDYINKGIAVSPSADLYEMGAKLLLQKAQALPDNVSLLEEAESMYLKAIDISDNPASLKKQIIFVYIDMGKDQTAIDISNELLNVYYDDPDLYFNVGVLYQRLATGLYDPTLSKYIDMSNQDNPSPSLIKEIYKNFSQARDYAKQSKEYYLQASDLELEDTGSYNAGMEMRKLVKQLNDTFIPSIKETAQSKSIGLD